MKSMRTLVVEAEETPNIGHGGAPGAAIEIRSWVSLSAKVSFALFSPFCFKISPLFSRQQKEREWEIGHEEWKRREVA